MRRVQAGLVGLLLAGLLGEVMARVAVAQLPWGDRYHILRADHFTEVVSEVPHYRSSRVYADADGVVLTRALGQVARYAWARPADGRRVVCLGDSITESWPEPDHTSWCDHLPFDQTLPLGVGGFDLVHQVAWYRQEFGRLEADRIYWQMGPNDLDELSVAPRTGLSLPWPHRWRTHKVQGRNRKAPVVGSSALYWMADHAFGALQGNRNQGLRLQVERSHLESILRSFPRDAIAVVLPILSPVHDQQEQQILVDALTAVGMPHIRIDGAGISARDPIHPDAAGMEVLGRQVAAADRGSD